MNANAQIPTLAWAKQAGGEVDDSGEAIAIDANGNSYVTGFFMHTVDFDPGPGVYNLTAVNIDIYILKLDPAGNFLWAKQFVGGNTLSHAYDIEVNSSGEIYTTGFFSGTVDFDPGPGVFNMTVPANLYGIMFISKLDNDGNFIWAKQIDAFESWDITFDANENLCITGRFIGTVDFDPGPGTYILSGWNNIFILKLKPNGNLSWARALEAGFFNNPNESYSIGVDGNNNVVITGRFFNTIDCDPGPGTYILTSTGSYSGFVVKLDALGNFIYAKQLGDGATMVEGNCLVVRQDGHVFISGYFNGTADFDPGPGTVNLSSPVHNDGYILELDEAGNFVRVKQFTSASGGIIWLFSLALDASNNVYATGYFSGAPIDFDPGPANYMVPTTNSWDGFVLKLDNSCNFLWVRTITDHVVLPQEPQDQNCMDIKISSSGSIFFTGNFKSNVALGNYPGIADFDPCQGNYDLSPSNRADIFVVRWDPYVPVTSSVNINSTATSICPGTSVTFTANTVNEGPEPVYQWQVNGINTGTNDPVYTSTGLANGDVVTVIMTPSVNCADNAAITSNSITITVSSPVVPSISIDVAGNPVCFGLEDTFTAITTNGGTSPQYQWKKNGVNVGTNNSVYTDNSLMDGDIINCVLTSNAGCTAPTTATSNSITLIVYPSVAPSIDITASSTNICSGTLVVFTSTVTNGGTTPLYYWRKNNIDVGTNPIYSDNTLVDGDIITCLLVSNLNCAVPNPLLSNSITITVSTLVIPSLNITASSANICAGTEVIFTAAPVNAGPTPQYQWKKNSVNVGTNSTTYSDNSFVNGDIITCILTSDAACAVSNTATSNSITMAVSPSVTPSLSITASATGICQGTTVVFSATPVNAGNSPQYQWQKNNVNVGTNSSTYSDNSLANGDAITCIVTSNAACLTTAAATSNSITITVNPIVVPALTMTASSIPVCQGRPVTFTVTSANQGIAPQYQWQKNNVNVGTNSDVYTDQVLNNGDIISCTLFSNASCVSPASTTASITVNVYPTPTITLSATPSTTLTEGSPVILTAMVSSTASIFEWYHNGTLMPALNSNTISVDYGAEGEYQAIATDVNGCTSASNKLLLSDSTGDFVFIYPNPNHGVFSVRYLNNETNTTRYITMWDSKGSKLYTGSFWVTGRQGQININVKNLSAGTYILQLSDKYMKRLKAGKLVIF